MKFSSRFDFLFLLTLSYFLVCNESLSQSNPLLQQKLQALLSQQPHGAVALIANGNITWAPRIPIDTKKEKG